MSNHHHTEVTDPAQNLPDFAEWLHGNLGRALNSLRGHWEGFWCPTRSYSAVLLGVAGEIEPVDYAEDALGRLVYIITNPARENLVKTYRDWPGVCSLHWRIGEEITVKRPDFFFRANGPTLPEITFRFTKPPGFEHLTDREFDQLLRHEVAEEEHALKRNRRSEGKRVLGRAQVLKQSPFASPRRPAPRRQLNPKVASRCPKRRTKMLSAISSFTMEYRACVRELLDGNREAVFPFGTLQRARYGGVRCRGPD